MEKKLKNSLNANKIILGILIFTICYMGIYSFTEVVPIVYKNENTNYGLRSVESMWWSPTSDFYYADSLIYTLGKGRQVRVYKDCPYSDYLSVYVNNLERVEGVQPKIDIVDISFQYIGKCDMKANHQLINEKFMEKLAVSDGIIGVYADTDSIAKNKNIDVLVDVNGDIYLYGK